MDKRAIAIVTFFPTLLIIIDVLAAVVYGYCGDLRRAVYWLAAAALMASVTF